MNRHWLSMRTADHARPYLGCLLFATFISLATPHPALSIEFDCPLPTAKYCKGHIWISGEIKPGDLQRFTHEVKKRGRDVVNINLFNSPGGDLGEAMKIGHQIRDLGMTTTLTQTLSGPRYMLGLSDKGLNYMSKRDTMCASACVFLWVAGLQRKGDTTVIVHRPYFDPKYFAGLNSSQAEELYESMAREAETYLRGMGASPDLWARIIAVRSDDTVSVDPVEVNGLVPETAPALEEWINAKCAPLSHAEDALVEIAGPKLLRHEALTSNEKAVLAKLDANIMCQINSVAANHEQAWTRVFGN